MTDRPEFALLPLDRLRAHERVEEENVRVLVEEIRATGVFSDPIWVARGTYVILNGHHRVEAARRLGAVRIPAWVVDYEGDLVSLEPWQPGLPITKAEVIRRAREGDLFPPKTTRHRLRTDLATRPTPLSELVATASSTEPSAPPQPPSPRRRPRPSGSGAKRDG